MVRVLLRFVRNHHTGFQSGCAILPFPPPWVRVNPGPDLPVHTLGHSDGRVACHRCTDVSLMTWDVEISPRACLPSVCTHSGRCLLQALVHLLMRLFVFLLLRFRSVFCTSGIGPGQLTPANAFSPSVSCHRTVSLTSLGSFLLIFFSDFLCR